jgi:hypothetical protein
MKPHMFHSGNPGPSAERKRKRGDTIEISDSEDEHNRSPKRIHVSGSQPHQHSTSAKGKAAIRAKLKISWTRTKEEKKTATDTIKGKGQENDTKNLPRRFTVYVQVWTSIIEKRAGSSKLKHVDIVTKGPFKTDTASNFLSFQEQVAKALPCRLLSLPATKIKWKFKSQP